MVQESLFCRQKVVDTQNYEMVSFKFLLEKTMLELALPKLHSLYVMVPVVASSKRTLRV